MALLLDEDVREALKRRWGDCTKIAQEAGVSQAWIVKFMQGKVPNPGYNTLRKVAEVLSRGTL